MFLIAVRAFVAVLLIQSVGSFIVLQASARSDGKFSHMCRRDFTDDFSPSVTSPSPSVTSPSPSKTSPKTTNFAPASRISPRSSRTRLPILSYTSSYACINKPFGISTHHSASSRSRRLVVSTSLKRQLSRKVYPVHRLDHRTSGCLLFAFSSEAAARLQQSLAKGQKEYVALVRGRWPHSETYNCSLPVTVTLKDGTKVSKASTTLITPLATDDKSSVLLCSPVTGRTHQIRRHLRELGHPIIGDSRYGDSKANRAFRTCECQV